MEISGIDDSIRRMIPNLEISLNHPLFYASNDMSPTHLALVVCFGLHQFASNRVVLSHHGTMGVTGLR